MNNYKNLVDNIRKKGSFLCIGLDTDLSQLPSHIKESKWPLFQFNKEIIDNTHDLCVAYKPNLAFYEAEGADGWIQLKMTIDYIKEKDSSILVIADAKRGDIGNTAQRYAKAFYESLNCDAVTLAPYMGRDSIDPFLQYKDKWSIILALTSNSSADEFETLTVSNEPSMPLYKKVILQSNLWGDKDNLMYVVGATRAEKLKEIREFCPDHFFLVPGVGAQGGTIEEVAKYGMNSNIGLLINVSRSLIYAYKEHKQEADSSLNFATYSRLYAQEQVLQMQKVL
jgi:orotidine-5'-phosphate decarboxylase